jgi:Arc/MetJ-type ribon-helix-helix transcriptional regulator
MAHYAYPTAPDDAGAKSYEREKDGMMPQPAHTISLVLPEHTVAQLDDMVRHGHFATRQEAITAAVERLYAEEATRHMTTRQAAFARLCGALQLGTTRASLRRAEHDRLTWESGAR